MRLRKILIAGTAMAVAATLALLPAAQATLPHGPISDVAVGGSTATADYGTTLTLVSASITMNVYGVPTTLTCSSGSAAGTAHAGSPAPATFMNFSSLTLTCTSFHPNYPNVAVSVPANGCANIVMSDPEVHAGTVDSGPAGGNYTDVDGTFNVTGACGVTVTAGPCTVRLGGSTPVAFDEALKSTSPDVQELKLTGAGLIVTSASILCLGTVAVADPITLDNVVFDVTTTGDAIDFQP